MCVRRGGSSGAEQRDSEKERAYGERDREKERARTKAREERQQGCVRDKERTHPKQGSAICVQEKDRECV